MKYLILIAGTIFLSSCSTIQNKYDKPIYKDHPIVGAWIYTSNGCNEIYEFTDTGFRMVHANQEVVKAKYEISNVAPESGVYLLKDTVIEDNGMPDCSGSTSDMSGDVVEVLLLIQYLPERFSFCFDKQLNNCVGPYVKQ
ncbi:hypothetical protein ACRN94_06710 [Shewanella baltica]|uniref:hypothetical protein n=1 Tax=Shewanella baltica TaxID=62322 RepID=UPI003D7AD7D0